jgi:predicted RNA-binding Zn-ribbon protein involved in translation (DUF1610 family)
MNKCGSCRYFIGGGDWALCCSKDYWLHYEESDACEKYERGEDKTGYCPICDKTITMVSSVSIGYCPDCGHHIVLRGEEVADV